MAIAKSGSDEKDGVSYGASAAYLAEAGKDYFRWQVRLGSFGGAVEKRKFARWLPETIGTVLDFGCGGGFLLASLDASHTIGIELNPEARLVAKERVNEVHRDLNAIPDAAVDLVISNHALEHVPHPIEALRELYRVLRPGGRFALCVPLDDWRVQKVVLPDRNHHLYTWTPRLLANLLEEAGFDRHQLGVEIITHAWPPQYERIFRLSPWLFDAAAKGWSIVRRRRQLMAWGRN